MVSRLLKIENQGLEQASASQAWLWWLDLTWLKRPLADLALISSQVCWLELAWRSLTWIELAWPKTGDFQKKFCKIFKLKLVILLSSTISWHFWKFEKLFLFFECLHMQDFFSATRNRSKWSRKRYIKIIPNVSKSQLVDTESRLCLSPIDWPVNRYSAKTPVNFS
jgi:hypothetical protein